MGTLIPSLIKIKRVAVMFVRACNYSRQEAEAGELRVKDQPVLCNKTFSKNLKICKKK